MRFYLTVLLLVVNQLVWGQFSDDFADGDFTSNPAWTGQTGNFIVNPGLELQLNAPAVTDTSYLATASSLINNTVWDFYVRMEFNPSSSNYTRVYLIADNPNLKGALNGYYVMLGNTADEISLYRQDGLAVTEILDGIDGVLNVNTALARVRVTRDAVGNWELFRDTSGAYNFVSEGSILDATYTSGNTFGYFCKYTSTRSTSFFFDNCGTPYVDATAPILDTAFATTATTVDVQFSEVLDQATAELVANYSLDNGIGAPISAVLNGTDQSLVQLTFATAFTNNTTYTLSVNNVEDLAGNSVISPSTKTFLYFVPGVPVQNDVIVTEFLCDQTPPIGLPEVEYVEIYNRSAKIFDLNGWTISDASASATIGSVILAPGDYLLLTGIGNGAQFFVTNYTEIALPSLNNTGDAIVIKDNFGNLIDSISYTDGWYQNTAKKDGGWSIERKHLDAPCNDINNWAASIDLIGGTPAIQNSIWTDLDDIVPPVISSYSVINAGEVEIIFSELLDTNSTALVTINPNVASISWVFQTEDKLSVYPTTMDVGVLYDLTISQSQDCWGNEMAATTIKVGLPDSIIAEDIILNEIMFDPLTNGSDYVELYNNSNKILDLKELYLADWDDSIANYKSIIATQRLLLPGEYVLITEDTNDIINDFAIYGLGTFIETDIPTYNNDSGSVYLMSKDSLIIDFFKYDEDMHFELLTTNDGKALERISFGGGMNNPDYWHSAAENVEWGTPGYKNSQSFYPNPTGTITVDPKLFSPNSDGFHDVVTISLELQSNDNVIDVEIFDNQGRLIRLLKDNFFAGNQVTITWDGITDNGEKGLIGTYIILISVLDAEGNQSQYKEVTVLGGDL